MKFSGKTAVITGGSRGIGRAIALELARNGANVVLCFAGREEEAAEAADACRALGAEALAIRCDVTDAGQVQTLMETALDRFGAIHILVNNAGITRDNLLPRITEADFDAVLDTNLKGAFLCMKAVCRTMLRQRWGRIVSISSVVGLHGNAGQASYAASKAGLIGLTRSMAKELGSRGVTANAVAPGYIETDMTASLPEKLREGLRAAIPAGRMGRPEDVAKAVAFLAGEEAAYITGQVLAVDGGLSM